MKALLLKDGIHWVGAIDWNLRNFHGYLTPRGGTYNAYLLAPKNPDGDWTLIDTVKEPFFDELMARIRSVVDPARIKHVISNHVEMDHSGSLPKLLSLLPGAKVYACPQGVKGLKEHYRPEQHGGWNFVEVKNGAEIEAGGHRLKVITTPNLHWPDNMMVYEADSRVLFSNDAFGQHLASNERFDDEMDPAILMHETKKYYGNILMFSNKTAARAVEMVKPLALDLIATSHGVVWRKGIREMLETYSQWATNQTENLALVVYDSMWGSTAKMAEAIADGFRAKGVEARTYCLTDTHISDVMTDVVTARYLCVGTPTLNGTIMPTVAGFLTYLRGLAPQGRRAMAFGSMGWGAQNITQTEELLKICGMELGAPIQIKYIPDEEQLAGIRTKIREWASSPGPVT